MRVKLVEHENETYVLARSDGRRDKESAMRRRRLRKLIRRLRELQQQDLTRDELLIKARRGEKRSRPRLWADEDRDAERRISR